MNSALARVARGDLCAGCGACVALAPDALRMEMTPPGYLRPQTKGPVSNAQNEAIARVCPGLGQRVQAGERHNDPLWGPFEAMYSGWSTDPELRYAGASGGALSGLLAHLIASDVVDAVIETSSDPEVVVANAIIVGDSHDDIRAAAGSRYAPSAPLADLPERLAEHRRTGRRFAFVGKPCDVAALRAMQDEDPELTQAIPVALSFFCAGVPSQTGAEAVLSALGVTSDQVRGFRYRGQGWPGRATATLADGSERAMSYHDSWGGILSKHVQHRCKICADGTGIAADIACADAWEADDRGYPLFEEGEGRSLIVTRTDLGRRLLEEAIRAGTLAVQPFDPKTLVEIQPGQRERRRALLARLSALRLSGAPVPGYKGLALYAAARQNSLRRNVKNFLGTLRRRLVRRS